MNFKPCVARSVIVAFAAIALRPDAAAVGNVLGPIVVSNNVATVAGKAKVSATQEDENRVDTLNNEVGQLLDAGKYQEAEARAKEALATAESLLGPDHQSTARSLNNLALLYLYQGRYAEAEPLFKRALAIFEKAMGPDHRETATVLHNLASLYRDEGRYSEAEPLLKRALAIREKIFGPDHPAIAASIDLLASLFQDQGRYSEAEPLFKRALTIREKALGPNHPDTATSINNLALLYQDQGRYGEAEPLYKRALAIRENGLGPNHPDTSINLNNLASLYRDQGRYGEAEPLFKRALTIDENALGPGHPSTATTLNNLAGLYEDQGRYGEAEPLFKRALMIIERTKGSDHPRAAASLGNLAVLYFYQGRYPEAEPLLKRALAIREKVLGPQHPDTATSLNNLGVLYQAQGRYRDAEPLIKRALAIRESTLGPNHRDTALSVDNLALLYEYQGRYNEAEPLFRRALALRENVLGPDHPDTAASLNNLAQLYHDQTRYADAEPLFNRALAIYERARVPDLPNASWTTFWLSRVQSKLGKADDAYRHAHYALDVLSHRWAEAEAAERVGATRERGTLEDVALQLVRSSYALAQRQPADAARLKSEALAAAQWIGQGATSRAVQQMAARFALGSGELAALLRRQQDLIAQRRAAEESLSNALCSSDPGTRAQADVFRKLSADLTAKLAQIDQTLRTDPRFKAYTDIVDPKPVPLAEAQGLLGDKEAMVFILVGEQEAYLFALTKNDLVWAKSDVTAVALQADVDALRRQLDPHTWRDVDIEAFDRARAYRLYTQIWAPIEGALKNKTEVFVIPSGPLTSLPVGVLVTEPLQGGAAGDEDAAVLRNTPWLIKRYALTTLPSLASLRVLRRIAKVAVANEPFAGFGDPVSSGDARSHAQRCGSQTSSRPALAGLPRTRSIASVFRGDQVDAPSLNALVKESPLCGSAEELQAMAETLKAPKDQSLWLDVRATERQIKSLDLSHKRVLAFATHGLTADEGHGEPGLVLSQPQRPDQIDDGYLRASEIAELKLGADWVLLSACNTGTIAKPGDKRPLGAEGLSLLARAFILAGAKSLVVSHWNVWDDTAKRLTTGMVQNFATDPAQGRAMALRKAQLDLLADTAQPRFAHPAAWAAFTLVGETDTARH